MRRKERDRRISPVVHQSGRSILDVELEHRQQFDGCDAELLKIGNLLDQAGISAALLFGNSGIGMARETCNVHLVNDGPGGRAPQRRVAFPIVRVRIHHHALHRRGGVVAFEARRRCGCNSWEQPRRARRGRGEPWWHQTAFRSRGRTARGLDSRKAAQAARPARKHANNGKYGWTMGRS